MMSSTLVDPIYDILWEEEVYATLVDRDLLEDLIAGNRLPHGHFLTKPDDDHSGIAAVSDAAGIRTIASRNEDFLICWLKNDGNLICCEEEMA